MTTLHTLLPLSDTRTKQLARALAPVLGKPYQATVQLLAGDPREAAITAYNAAPPIAVDTIVESVLGHRRDDSDPPELPIPLARTLALGRGLLLIGGPAAAGKTTLANTLATHMRSTGIKVRSHPTHEPTARPGNPKVGVFDEVRSPAWMAAVADAAGRRMAIATVHCDPDPDAVITRALQLLSAGTPGADLPIVRELLAHDLVGVIAVSRDAERTRWHGPCATGLSEFFIDTDRAPVPGERTRWQLTWPADLDLVDVSFPRT